MQNSIVLSENKTYQVVQFCTCGHIGVKASNTLLSLDKDAFQAFTSSFSAISFDHHSITFPDDISRIIIRTPSTYVQLCFDEKEFEAMRQLLNEASILIQTRAILDLNNEE
ncbi:MAG: DUF6686 family protein [Bacteroidota bacterium]